MVGALCLACRHGHTDAVQLLLSYGVPRNVEVKVDPYSDARAVSPLECASASGNAQIAMQLVAAAPPLNLRYVREHLESLFRRSPRSLTAAGIPAAQWLLTPRRGDLIRESAPDLLARADSRETEQQLLALCCGVRDHVPLGSAPGAGGPCTAAGGVTSGCGRGGEGGATPVPGGLERGHVGGRGAARHAGGAAGDGAQDVGRHCVPAAGRALEAGSMEDVRVQLAAACAGADDGGGAAAPERGVGPGYWSARAQDGLPRTLTSRGPAPVVHLRQRRVLRRRLRNVRRWRALSGYRWLMGGCCPTCVVKGGVDLVAKLLLLLDVLAEIEPAEEDMEEPQRDRGKPGPVPFSPQAVLRVAWALEAAVKLQGGGAALGLLLRDERARAAARRVRTRIRLLKATCRGGNVGTLRVQLGEGAAGGGC